MTAPENPPMEIPTKIGRYEILAELGRGAMGTVYRAKDPAMDRVVALKTIISVVLASEQGSEFRERFYREARAAGALAHPGIVPVFDVGEHEGMPYLVMEFVTGRTLADTAKQGERLSLDRVCEIGQKIAEALGYAHQHGVVHRDIKPANILLTSRETYGIERPKITDFGVAKLAEGQTTLTGQMVGTPAFMPPEQFTGAPIDRRADIFSLGVVLYWLTTGEQPFPGESMTAVSYKVVHTDPVPPRKLNPSVPAKLDSVILKCLAKSPDERYQTGEELARELDALRTGDKGKLQSAAPAGVAAQSDPDATLIGSVPRAAAGAVAATQQPGQTAVHRGKRDNRLMLAAIVVVAVAAAVGGWFALRGRQKSAVQTPPQSPVQTVAQVVAPPSAATSATPVAETGATNVPKEVARTSEPAAKTPTKKTPAKAAPAGASVAAAKPDTTAEAKADASPAPKAPEAAPAAAPGAVGFDPRKLDRKQNAKLDIDAARMPAGVDFTVLMNGKVYLQKTGAQSNLGDEDFFVPPGVQEFLVIAKSGAVEKTSNTVSTEFLAKKRNTLKIEARSKGMPPGSGVPQGLYPDTEIVVTLK
ncbi:MAG: serine/threonine-protein kinase [Candidatus Acidiferrales bacterium]